MSDKAKYALYRKDTITNDGVMGAYFRSFLNPIQNGTIYFETDSPEEAINNAKKLLLLLNIRSLGEFYIGRLGIFFQSDDPMNGAATEFFPLVKS